MLIALVLAVTGILVVGFSCKSAETLMKNVNAEWIYTQYCHIDTKVELKVIDQQRISNIVAHDQRGVLLQLRKDSGHLGSYSDAFSLRAIMWFDNISDARRTSHLLF